MIVTQFDECILKSNYRILAERVINDNTEGMYFGRDVGEALRKLSSWIGSWDKPNVKILFQLCHYTPDNPMTNWGALMNLTYFITNVTINDIVYSVVATEIDEEYIESIKRNVKVDNSVPHHFSGGKPPSKPIVLNPNKTTVDISFNAFLARVSYSYYLHNGHVFIDCNGRKITIANVNYPIPIPPSPKNIPLKERPNYLSVDIGRWHVDNLSGNIRIFGKIYPYWAKPTSWYSRNPSIAITWRRIPAHLTIYIDRVNIDSVCYDGNYINITFDVNAMKDCYLNILSDKVYSIHIVPGIYKKTVKIPFRKIICMSLENGKGVKRDGKIIKYNVSRCSL